MPEVRITDLFRRDIYRIALDAHNKQGDDRTLLVVTGGIKTGKTTSVIPETKKFLRILGHPVIVHDFSDFEPFTSGVWSSLKKIIPVTDSGVLIGDDAHYVSGTGDKYVAALLDLAYERGYRVIPFIAYPLHRPVERDIHVARWQTAQYQVTGHEGLVYDIKPKLLSEEFAREFLTHNGHPDPNPSTMVDFVLDVVPRHIHTLNQLRGVRSKDDAIKIIISNRFSWKLLGLITDSEFKRLKEI